MFVIIIIIVTVYISKKVNEISQIDIFLALNDFSLLRPLRFLSNYVFGCLSWLVRGFSYMNIFGYFQSNIKIEYRISSFL